MVTLLSQIIAELGPWLWMIAGIVLMTCQIFLRGSFVLAAALAALLVGTLAVMGASGIIYSTSFSQQSGIFLVVFLSFLAVVRFWNKKKMA